eukprot:6188369-Pleurochrysis_carterae.AAC.2
MQRQKQCKAARQISLHATHRPWRLCKMRMLTSLVGVGAAAALTAFPHAPAMRAGLVAASQIGAVNRVNRSPSPQTLASAPPPDWKTKAASALCALLFVASPLTIDSAEAASRGSGGRMGGRVAPRAAPTPSRTHTHTNTVIVQPAPTVVSPFPSYGYGGGYGYGYVAPSPGLVGLSVGLDIAGAIMREQQRQAFLEQQLRTQRELGADQVKIAELQRQLAEQNSKIDQLRYQQQSQPGQPAMQP